MIKSGSQVTVTFELPPSLDPQQFVEWLRDEVENESGGNEESGFHRSVKLLSPVTINLYGDGK